MGSSFLFEEFLCFGSKDEVELVMLIDWFMLKRVVIHKYYYSIQIKVVHFGMLNVD